SHESGRLGVRLDDGRILDLTEADSHFEDLTAIDFIRIADFLRPLADQAVARADELPTRAFLSESQAALLAPIPRPVSMRDAYAFRQHVETARRNRGLEMIPEF